MVWWDYWHGGEWHRTFIDRITDGIAQFPNLLQVDILINDFSPILPLQLLLVYLADKLSTMRRLRLRRIWPCVQDTCGPVYDALRPDSTCTKAIERRKLAAPLVEQDKKVQEAIDKAIRKRLRKQQEEVERANNLDRLKYSKLGLYCVST